MRISDWSSDVCSSDLLDRRHGGLAPEVRSHTPVCSLRWRGVVQQIRENGGLCKRGGGREDGNSVRGWFEFSFLIVFLSFHMADRQSVVSGKSVSVRVNLGGSRIIKKKKHIKLKTHQ